MSPGFDLESGLWVRGLGQPIALNHYLGVLARPGLGVQVQVWDQAESGSSKPESGSQSPCWGFGAGIGGPCAGRGLTQQQQLHLPRRLLAVLPQVLVDHLGALGRRLVLGAHGAAHPAVRRPGRPRPPHGPGPARPARPAPLAPAAGPLGVALGSTVPSVCGRRLPGLRAQTAGGPGVGPEPAATGTGPGRARGRGHGRPWPRDWPEGGATPAGPAQARADWRRRHGEGESQGGAAPGGTGLGAAAGEAGPRLGAERRARGRTAGAGGPRSPRVGIRRTSRAEQEQALGASGVACAGWGRRILVTR